MPQVVPQSKGGLNTWENLVACCSPCNGRKGNKSLSELRWKLRQVPKEPSPHALEFMLGMLLGTLDQSALPAEWQAYIVPFTRSSSSGSKKQQQQQQQQEKQQHVA